MKIVKHHNLEGVSLGLLPVFCPAFAQSYPFFGLILHNFCPFFLYMINKRLLNIDICTIPWYHSIETLF